MLTINRTSELTLQSCVTSIGSVGKMKVIVLHSTELSRLILNRIVLDPPRVHCEFLGMNLTLRGLNTFVYKMGKIILIVVAFSEVVFGIVTLLSSKYVQTLFPIYPLTEPL